MYNAVLLVSSSKTNKTYNDEINWYACRPELATTTYVEKSPFN